MRFFIIACIIAAAAAIHLEENVRASNDRYGRDYQASKNLDINIEAVRAARTQEYNRYPTNNYHRRHNYKSESSCSDSNDRHYRNYNKDVRAYAPVVQQRTEKIEAVKVGDAQ